MTLTDIQIQSTKFPNNLKLDFVFCYGGNAFYWIKSQMYFTLKHQMPFFHYCYHHMTWNFYHDTSNPFCFFVTIYLKFKENIISSAIFRQNIYCELFYWYMMPIDPQGATNFSLTCNMRKGNLLCDFLKFDFDKDDKSNCIISWRLISLSYL